MAAGVRGVELLAVDSRAAVVAGAGGVHLGAGAALGVGPEPLAANARQKDEKMKTRATRSVSIKKRYVWNSSRVFIRGAAILSRLCLVKKIKKRQHPSATARTRGRASSVVLAERKAVANAQPTRRARDFCSPRLISRIKGEGGVHTYDTLASPRRMKCMFRLRTSPTSLPSLRTRYWRPDLVTWTPSFSLFASR